MKPPRDSQRARLYAAERVAFEAEYRVLRLETLPAVRAFLDGVLADSRFRAVYGHFSSVRLKDGRGTRHAYAAYDQETRAVLFSLPRWSRTRPIVLHELAHVASLHRHGRIAPHGPEFAAVYIELVERHLGRIAALRLKRLFRVHRVRFGSTDPG